MGDLAELRVVRCPKCENLLPELPTYSVYQSKKSDSEGYGVISEKTEDFRGKIESLHGNGSKEPLEKCDIENANNVEHDSSAGQLKHYVEKPTGLRSSDGFAKQKGLVDGVGRVRRVGPEVVEFRSLNYAGEGTSRCYMNGSIDRNQNELNKCNGAESVRPDREELLRKLDELKEQLSKSCDVNDKHKEKDSMDMRVFGLESSDHPSGFRRGSRQLYAWNAPDGHGIRPHSFDHYREPYAAMQRPEVSMCNYQYHSSVQGPSHVHAYENEFPSHLYTFPTYTNLAVSQLSCSCSRCYYTHFQHEEQISPAACRRYPSVSSKFVWPHLERHGPFFRQGYNSRISHTASSCDHRLVGTDSRKRCNRPMAGGAPFVTCHDCNELLELPKKILELDKSRCKIRCGGCSSVISFAMVDEKLTPVDNSPKQALKDDLDSSGELLHGRPYDPHGGMRQENAGFHSKDYESSAYDFLSAEREHVLLSSSASEDEVRADNFIAGISPLPHGSPLEEHFDRSSTHCVVNRHGKGNLSSRSDQERILPSKNTTRQNSLKESPATELDVSLNEYSSTGVFHDTADTSGEEDPPKAKRGVDSFFAGVIKKSFRDLSKSIHTTDNGKGSVSINGHLIPDRLVKKAEKLAGPISPGQYWYDVKAGFWGVMGGPCLGIVPPHIEEFSYPMPQNCACGNTGVFVNGRELHLDDLDLLSRRGLPVATNRSYIIEISGEVVDEDSGVELESLGKLAPTVEKAKHGFGMRQLDRQLLLDFNSQMTHDTSYTKIIRRLQPKHKCYQGIYNGESEWGKKDTL